MIGGFSTKTTLGGEAVKNRLLAEEFVRQGVETEIVETSRWQDRLPEVIRDVVRKTVGRDRIFFVCSHPKGAMMVMPYLLSLKALTNAELRYMVVGYDLFRLFELAPPLARAFGRFDRLYVETAGMKRDLEQKWGLDNVVFIPNFRPREQEITSRPRALAEEGELRTVFFSRVVRTKGADVAIEAVKQANRSNPGRRIILDIWGLMDPDYRAEFESLIHGVDEINYRGLIPLGQCNQTLADYHFMLFPSRYGGEVFPGVALESMAAGVPVMLSDWHYNDEVVSDGKDGFLLPATEVPAWTGRLLQAAAMSPDEHAALSRGALETAASHLPDKVVGEFVRDVFPEKYHD